MEWIELRSRIKSAMKAKSDMNKHFLNTEYYSMQYIRERNAEADKYISGLLQQLPPTK